MSVYFWIFSTMSIPGSYVGVEVIRALGVFRGHVFCGVLFMGLIGLGSNLVVLVHCGWASGLGH